MILVELMTICFNFLFIKNTRKIPSQIWGRENNYIKEECLNSDAQQFYQISTKLTIISHLKSLNIKQTMTYAVEIQVLARDLHINVPVIYWLIWCQPPQPLIIRSATAMLIYTNKQNTCTGAPPLKYNTHYHNNIELITTLQ